MRLKYQFETMNLEDQVVAVPVGADVNKFRGVVKLNETSAFIFGLLAEDTTEEAIVDAMEKEYDAPLSVITEDVRKIIAEFEEKGLLIR